VAVHERKSVLFDAIPRLHRSIPSLARKSQKLDVVLVEASVFVNHVVEERFAVCAQMTRCFDRVVCVFLRFGGRFSQLQNLLLRETVFLKSGATRTNQKPLAGPSL
jgi:hypothetical protein